jgi:hypothetical protein
MILAMTEAGTSTVFGNSGQQHHRSVPIHNSFLPVSPTTIISPLSSLTRNDRSVSTSSHHSAKRSRDSESESSLEGTIVQLSSAPVDNSPFYPSAQFQPCPENAKKTRSITYAAPRKVSNSLLSSMGSLASSAQDSHTNSLCVPFRQRLSSSKLDEYFQQGHHDSMEIEAAETRPRSMSF